MLTEILRINKGFNREVSALFQYWKILCLSILTVSKSDIPKSVIYKSISRVYKTKTIVGYALLNIIRFLSYNCHC